jgi:hypothetical protein
LPLDDDDDMQAQREAEVSRQALLQSSTLEAQYESQLRQAREQLVVKMREMEDGWKRQMVASPGVITRLEEEKTTTASNAAVNASQVRQQLLEMQALKVGEATWFTSTLNRDPQLSTSSLHTQSSHGHPIISSWGIEQP